jgi:hypothetical protein
MLPESQGVYQSLVNEDKTIFCMKFISNYPRYTKELAEECFIREREYILRLQKFSWAPEVLEINPSTQCIKFKWYDNTCETKLPVDWQAQLEQIIKDLHSEQIYKPQFYPKFFYTDDSGKLRAFSFFSSSTYQEQPVDIDFFLPIINADRLETISHLIQDQKLDMAKIVELAFTNYIKWPEDPLPEIYRRVYE